MTPLPALAAWPIRIAASALLVWLILIAYRWLHEQSPLVARLLAIGLMARATAGVVLFLASVYEWPVMTGLQLGGGFWTLAIDARSYYDAAAHAVSFGLETIHDESPSPFFVRMLALFMWPFGVSPAAAILLNTLCYAAIIVLIVVAAGRGTRRAKTAEMPLVVGVAAFTFSPAMLIFGTQPLKDQLCALLIVAALAGARAWWAGLTNTVRRRDQLAAGAVLMMLAVYGLGGIRAYAAVFLLGALSAAGVYSLARSAKTPRFRRAALHVGLGILLMMAFAAGAGPYYEYYRDQARQALTQGTPEAMFDSSRDSFAATGGATSVVSPAVSTPGSADPAHGPGRATPANPQTDRAGRPTPEPRSAEPQDGTVSTTSRQGRGYALARGLAVTLVPISVLQALSIVDFSGGAGLLWITDLDTVFIDVTLIVGIYFLVTSLKRRPLSPAALCALVLGAALLLSMAYVVTNFGTLFRLRLLALAPLWTLFALLPQEAHAEESEQAAEPA